MAFLQQVCKSVVDLNTNANVVAFHQGSSTILLIEGTSYVTKQRNPANEWLEIGRWVVPEGFPAIIMQTSLEAYGGYLLLTSDQTKTQILFFTLHLKLCNICELSHIYNVLSGDFDQLRKDLLLGLKGGTLLSVIIRRPQLGEKPILDLPAINSGASLQQLTAKPAKPAPPGPKHPGGEYANADMVFQTIPRKHCRFSRSFIGSPMQIASQDMLSTFLMLSDNGNVICFETGIFEVLWHIKPVHFLDNPIYLWVNKFCPDFVIKFRIKATQTSSTGKPIISDRHSYDEEGESSAHLVC